MKLLLRPLCPLLVTLFSIFTSVNVASQERISEILGPGAGQRQILKSFQGENFMLTIDQFDSLKIFKIDGNTIEYQHARKFIGIHEQPFLRHTDQFFLLEDSNGSIAYNFISNQEQVFPYEGDNRETSWSLNRKDEVVLSQYSSTSKSQWLVDLSIDLQIEIDNIYTISGNTEQSLLLKRCSTTEDCDFYNYDKASQVIDSLYNGPIYTSRVLLTDQHFYYFNDNMLISYNKATQHRDILTEIDEINNPRMYDSRDQVLITYQSNDAHYLTILDKEMGNEKSFEIKMGAISVPRQNVENHIIFGQANDIYDYNIATQELQEIDSHMPFSSTVVLDDRYLLYGHEGEHKLFDFQTSIIYDIGGHYGGRTTFGTSHIENDGSYLVNWIHNIDADLAPLWEVNVENKMITPRDDLLPSSEEGLEERATLISVDDQIIVVEKDLHIVRGESVERLNTGSLVESDYSYYKITNNKLFWVENIDTDLILCSLVDGERTEVLDLQMVLPEDYFQKIEEYEVTDKYVYIFKQIDWELRLVQIDRSTFVETTVEDVPVNTFGINLLFSSEDILYYAFYNSIYAIGDDSHRSTSFIDNNIETYNLVYSYNDKFYLNRRENIYKIDGHSVGLVLGPDSEFLLDCYPSGKYLNARSIDEEVYVTADGDSWEKIPVPDNYNPSHIGDDYLAFVSDSGSNQNETSLYHIPTGRLIELPEQYQSYKYTSIFEHLDQTIALARSGSFPNYRFHLISLAEDPNLINELENFESNGGGTNSVFVSYEEEGFLYAGSQLFLMNNSLEFVSLDPSVAGDFESVNVIERNGFFYFIAFDAQLGRQVFRVQVFSERNAQSVKNSKVAHINIFPNPTTTSISVNGLQADGTWNYRIVTLDGRQIISAIYNGMIPIKRIAKGHYIIQLTKGKEVRVGTFVKN